MKTTARTWLATGAVGLAGLAAGGIFATSFSATAEDTGTGDTSSQTARQGPDEEPLTGDTADKVRAAVEAEYPGATIDRLETDSEGVYEAHVVTADGTPVTVEVDEDFEVTGEQEGAFGHHGPGPGGPDEEELTGGTADSVRRAALAEYPGATVVRVETDSEGGYEAHLVAADGTPVTVLVDEDLDVTGEEEGFGHHEGDLGGPGAGGDDGTTQDSSTT